MASRGANGQEDDGEYNPLKVIADIIDRPAPILTRPRPETDRRTNYREAPAPPGVNLAATALEDAVRRDAAIVEHAYEISRATERDGAEHRTLSIPASTGREIISHILDRRPVVAAELRARIDATADRQLRRAYAAMTRTRLVCPHCGGQTVVPTPDLKSLVCLDYVCAPDRPRRIDPASAQEPDRRVTVRQLALLAGEEEAAIRKKVWRAKIAPVHTGPHNRHEYRWADVAHLVAAKPTTPAASAPNANREARSGRIGSAATHQAAAA